MTSAEIREKFLNYFENHGHQRVKSSSLIPAADPTLLFTNAGMVQFKDNFLGVVNNGYTRATTCQKCVRAGGKHNDLENVGYTPRHHTFFEMLGNFSFGDYFKKEAISFAWELLTHGLNLPKDRLRVTVYEKDDEAFALWKAQGVPTEWITRLGDKDNFWAMGDTGPCGPCTEIHYDWGEEYGCKNPHCDPGCACGTRFLEIWNLVFMQFNRDPQGKLHPLPKPSVDTGAGLERLAAVLQGKYSNYDTDVFQPILQAIAKKAGKTYGHNTDDDVSMRVIADHLRSGTFLLADGVTPSNEGRGYVLRRILRRAIRHGKKLGQDAPFIYSLIPSIVKEMGHVYNELRDKQALIETLFKEEEERFHETLHRGLGLLEESVVKTKNSQGAQLSGEIAFKLYDTFGFPLDLIEVICQERGLTVDIDNFNTLMEKQRSQSVWKGAEGNASLDNIAKALPGEAKETRFLGYAQLETDARVLALFSKMGLPVKALLPKEEGFVVFDKTSFYAESGGQVGDKGEIREHDTVAQVIATSKIGKTTIHRINLETGMLAEGIDVRLSVDPALRRLTAINHTATHMLHATLRKLLGDRVKQAGSLVDPSKLRFDFTFPRALSEKEIEEIEKTINAEIQRNEKVETIEMTFDKAIQSGALAFFDEKYGDVVRVVRVGDHSAPFSVELCGGTHLHHTGEIRLFKVLSESSVASGVRRIEAVTSETALDFLLGREKLLGHIEAKLGAQQDATLKKIDLLQAELKSLQKENEKLQLKWATGGGSGSSAGSGSSLWERSRTVKGYQLVAEEVQGINPKILRTMVDQVKDKLKEKTLVLLASKSEGKAFLCVGITKDLTQRWDASKIIQPLALEVGGTGGGRGDFAQAGGSKPEGITKAIEKLESWLLENG